MKLQLAGSEEYHFARGDKVYTNRYYRPDPADFPAIDSFLLTRPSHLFSPIVVVFHIAWDAREHHVSKGGLCSIDKLPLPKNTRQYHVVVSPENLFPKIKVLKAHFEGEGKGGEQPSNRFQIFNCPIPFSRNFGDDNVAPDARRAGG